MNYCRCWTSNKKDKLNYFQASKMWFLKDKVNEEISHLHKGSKLMQLAIKLNSSELKSTDKWFEYSRHICKLP